MNQRTRGQEREDLKEFIDQYSKSNSVHGYTFIGVLAFVNHVTNF